MNFNGIPKGKEKNRLYEPIAVSVVKPFTGVLKKLVDVAEGKRRNWFDWLWRIEKASERDRNK